MVNRPSGRGRIFLTVNAFGVHTRVLFIFNHCTLGHNIIPAVVEVEHGVLEHTGDQMLIAVLITSLIASQVWVSIDFQRVLIRPLVMLHAHPNGAPARVLVLHSQQLFTTHALLDLVNYLNMVVIAYGLVVVQRREPNVVFRVVVAVVLTVVVAKLARVVGVNVPLAALKAGRQYITQGELIFDLVDSLHISDDLKGATMHQAEAGGCLLLVGGVGYVAS